MTTSRTAASLAQRLLSAAVAHVPAHGFTVRAAQAAAAAAAGVASSSKSSEPSQEPTSQHSSDGLTPQEAAQLRDSPALILQLAVPGSSAASSASSAERAFAQRLLARWDAHAVERSVKSWRAGQSARAGRAREHDQAQPVSLEQLVDALEARLHISAEARAHLLSALAAEAAIPLPSLARLARSRPRSLDSYAAPSSAASTASALLPSALPTPLPLARRAWRTVDGLAHGVGWRDVSFGPSWYAHRARLAFAYALAELHLAASPGAVSSPFHGGDASHAQGNAPLAPPVNASPPAPGSAEAAAAAAAAAAPSAQLLRRLALSGATSPLADAQRALGAAASVAQWGGRGWLGVFRSRGW